MYEGGLPSMGRRRPDRVDFAHGTIFPLPQDLGCVHGGYCCHTSRRRCDPMVCLVRAHPRSPYMEMLGELRSTKGLCWPCDEPWSRDHHYKRGRLLMIKPIEESEPRDVDLESEEEDMEEDPQPTVNTIHALANSNPQMMKIEGFLKHQPIIILIDTRSTNNFMDSKVVAQLTLR
ncbi:hypothetical protein BHE74_00023791 [Ensete ventricosum]|nr:hypothetical protein GW17_00051095 [Ensete ventricosum]RWW68674.1 hypothetical protein BHE74_00023791 [Ensete ventricosum]